MAAKPKAADPAVEEAQEAPRVPVKAESVYTAEELANNHNAFQTSREIVTVALRLSGKTSATYPEAKTIIDQFKNKEVKS